MLEQELYNQESNTSNAQANPAQAAAEPDLFRNYEIRHWDFSPTFYKILAASAIFNVAALVVFAQSNVLMTRGCDSPLVSKFCQVLDTVYVGSVLLGTDTEFASRDYEKTQLEDSDITYIDVSGQTPPLNYPEGYFALANPEQFAMQQQAEVMAGGDMSGFTMPPTGSIPVPGMPSNDLMNVTPTLPTPNNNPVVGELPTSPLGTNPIGKGSNNFPMGKYRAPKMPRMPKIKNDSPKELPKSEEDEKTAENKAENVANEQKPLESEPVKEIEINKKPFEDLGDTINGLLAKKEVDLNQPFTVVLDGVLLENGKLDQKKSKFVDWKGNQQMIDVAKTAIQAVGDSGFLGHLKNMGVDKVKITLVQDDKQIYAIVISDQKTATKASTIASGFNTLLTGIKIADESGLRKLDDNSRTLIKNSKVTNDGRNFVLNFAIPKQDAQVLIDKSLKDRAEKKAAEPNSSAEANNNTKAKSVK